MVEAILLAFDTKLPLFDMCHTKLHELLHPFSFQTTNTSVFNPDTS
jgi:hypothetical protein